MISISGGHCYENITHFAAKSGNDPYECIGGEWRRGYVVPGEQPESGPEARSPGKLRAEFKVAVSLVYSAE
jgi:hypothetical protein